MCISGHHNALSASRRSLRIGTLPCESAAAPGFAFPSQCQSNLCPSSPSPFTSLLFPRITLPIASAQFNSLSKLFLAVLRISVAYPRNSCHCILCSTPFPSISLPNISFPSRSFAGLTRGAVSAMRVAGVTPQPSPPTRSDPCRCCATGTGRAGDRSQAIRARSPRPWGSSRGC